MYASNQTLAQNIKQQVLADLRPGITPSGARSNLSYNDLVETVKQNVLAQVEPFSGEGPTQPLSYQDLALADQVKRDVLARIEAERKMFPPGFINSITQNVITELETRQEAAQQTTTPTNVSQGVQAAQFSSFGHPDPALVEAIKRDVLMELRTSPRH